MSSVLKVVCRLVKLNIIQKWSFQFLTIWWPFVLHFRQLSLFCWFGILVEFQWERLENFWKVQNWLFQVISDHFGEKRLESCETCQIGCSSIFEPLWWEKIGKVAKHTKLAVPSDFGSLQWEKIRKVARPAKLAILSDFGPCQWKKIRKVAKCVNLAIPSDFRSLQWEKLPNVPNWLFWVILNHFGRKSSKMC